MNININYRHIYILGAFPLLLTACTSLDEEPYSNQVTTQFYKNEADAKAAVTAVYSALKTGVDTQPMYNRGIQLATDISTDDYVAGPRAINANVQALSKVAHDASNDRLQCLWQDHYSAINYANVAIDNIGAISSGNISESVRQQYINEAKFLRALFYFNLVRWFRNVPLILHETTSLTEENLHVKQAAPEEVYEQIIKDLKDAENLPEPAQAEKGRASAGSAKALLAKVYLTLEQWELAADKSREIINSGWYGLFENYNDVFDASTKNGKEHIFSIQWQGFSGLGYHFLAATSSTYSVPGINGSYADAYNTSSDLYASYEENDQRRDVSFVTEMVSPTDGKTYQLPAPTFYKYYDQGAVGSQGNSSRNFNIIRYSEVLLFFAEAQNELKGPDASAFEAIDKVRTRAGVRKLSELHPNATKDEFREYVFEERRKEFVYEYNRWFDLSRRGGEYLVKKLHAAGKTNAKTKHAIFPIPQRELDLNPNLVQNEEWR